MPAGGNNGGGTPAAPTGSGGKGGLNAVRGTHDADLLIGTNAADWIDGRGGDDTLFGGAGNDLIDGDQGNDTFVGGSGDDTFVGGHDTDTALYIDDTAGSVSTDPADYYSVFGYGFAISPDGATITDIDGTDGNTGTDSLDGVEQAVFSDVDADGDGVAGLVTVNLDGTNNAVLAVVDYAATDEDVAIQLQADDLIANDVEFDGDAKELVSVQDAVAGSVSLAPDGTITFTPTADFSGTASFTYIVSDGLGGTDTQTVYINVAAVTDAPQLSVGPTAGDEDTAIALDLSAALGDTDGSETLSLVVSGIPLGAVLSDGIHSFTAVIGSTQVDIANWNQAALTVTPLANSDADFQLNVTATATEAGNSVQTEGVIGVTVNAVADAPIFDLNTALDGMQNVGATTGHQDSPIALNSEIMLADTDGSESCSSLVISAIPDGATLSDGVNSFTATALNSSVDITGWNVGLLTVTPPPGSDLDFQLQVTATSIEASNGDTATTQGSIDVTVLGEVGAPTIDLNAFPPSAGFTVFGADTGDQSGWSVSEAGDINGDGFTDLLIGAIYGDGLGDANLGAGETYVVFGKGSGLADIDLSALSATDGFIIGGAAAGDQSGGFVSSAGDINGDGFDDIIIGATNANGGAGESYVIFGQAGGFTDIDLGSLAPSEGFTISGIDAGDQAGFSVASAGDINGDGFDDYIVGAYLADGAGAADADYGESYVMFGKAGGFTDVDLSTLSGSDGFTIVGGGLGDQAGWSVASAGDVNGDGFDDVIIGAPRAGGIGDGKSYSGESYVLFGDAGGFGNVDPSTLTPADGFTIYGADVNDRLGYSVSSAGDFNGDGYADVIVGAIGAKGDGNATFNSGEAYVVFGKATGIGDIDLSVISSTDWFTIRGTDKVDTLGRSVSSAGDINGDGFDDIIVGAWLADGTDEGKTNSGESYVIFGKADGFGPIEVNALAPTEGFTILGGVLADQSGASVSAAGDINGDGYDDIIVGAPLASGSGGVLGNTAGESYVIYGSNLTGAVTQEGTELNDVLVGTAANDVMVAGLGDDTLIGGGGGDVLTGGAGNDLLTIGDTSFARIDGGTGHDTLALDGSGENLDLTLLGSMEVEGIEAVDLSGAGANELTLNTQDVLQLSDETNDLQVLGNGDDSVTLVGDFAAAGQESVGGVLFDVYASAGTEARVLAENADVNVNLVVA